MNDYVSIDLEGVKVIPTDQYNMLIGCDVLRGDGKFLGEASLHMAGKVVWVLLQEGGANYFSHTQAPGGQYAVHDNSSGNQGNG